MPILYVFFSARQRNVRVPALVTASSTCAPQKPALSIVSNIFINVPRPNLIASAKTHLANSDYCE